MAETGEGKPGSSPGVSPQGVSASSARSDGSISAVGATTDGALSPSRDDIKSAALFSDESRGASDAESSEHEKESSESSGEQSAENLDQKKVDAAIAANFAGSDLSQDNLPPPTPADNIALQESIHRTRLQWSVFTIAMIVVALLFAAAIGFGSLVVLRYYRATDHSPIDWHVSALAGAFVIPPTVILIALIRAIYYKSEDKTPTESLPALNLIKDILVAVKEAAKAVK